MQTASRGEKQNVIVDAPKDPEDCVRVGGAVGAMVGAVGIGRPLAVLGSGVALGALGGALFGGVGAVVGGAAGLYLGNKAEQQWKLGRRLGGMAGGYVGTKLGKLAGDLGWQPGSALAQECKGFSLESLPAKLNNVHYTSHPKLSAQIAAEGARHAQPGDLIITNDDGDFKLELIQKGLGLIAKGPGPHANWTHLYTVDNNGMVLDILIGDGGPNRFPLPHAFKDNTHAKILRPEYSSPEARDEVLKWMNDQFGRVTYDMKFSLASDDKLYCQEYFWKGVREKDPHLAVEPSSIGKWKFITADNFDHSPKYKEIWSTGSNFWMNWLSHFT